MIQNYRPLNKGQYQKKSQKNLKERTKKKKDTFQILDKRVQLCYEISTE